ncbi:MAG: hypothetical protein HGA33_02995 [Candidatus Moranbacteria bacterium]|nr:hypothetical protein [Candidatus Moranbacteria bacterium]
MRHYTITPEEARGYIDEIGPSLGCDFTYSPAFPKERQDVCLVVHAAENGVSYGYDTLYLVWKDEDGHLRNRELANTRCSKDYISSSSIEIEGDTVTVKFGSGGAYSGSPWETSCTSKL